MNRLWRYREGGVSVTYAHNAFGERQIKDDGTSKTRFVYRGPSLLHEQEGGVDTDYIYLSGEVVGIVKNGSLYFVHNDHLGRPEYLTNSAKTVVWSSENNAFDNVPGTITYGNLNIGFPGQYYDIESGTYYNYQRTYDGTTGRYLQSDPIGLAGGLNTYVYAGSNPLSRIDPYGLDWFGEDSIFRDTGILGGCAAGGAIGAKTGAGSGVVVCSWSGPGMIICAGGGGLGGAICGCAIGAFAGGWMGEQWGEHVAPAIEDALGDDPGNNGDDGDDGDDDADDKKDPGRGPGDDIDTWPLDTGAEEWARRNPDSGVSRDEAQRRAHRIKKNDYMQGSTDDYRTDPATGDVYDPEGYYSGNIPDDYN